MTTFSIFILSSFPQNCKVAVDHAHSPTVHPVHSWHHLKSFRQQCSSENRSCAIVATFCCQIVFLPSLSNLFFEISLTKKALKMHPGTVLTIQDLCGRVSELIGETPSLRIHSLSPLFTYNALSQHHSFFNDVHIIPVHARGCYRSSKCCSSTLCCQIVFLPSHFSKLRLKSLEM